MLDPRLRIAYGDLYTPKRIQWHSPLHKGRMWAHMFCPSKDSIRKNRGKERLETQVPLFDTTANLCMVTLNFMNSRLYILILTVPKLNKNTNFTNFSVIILLIKMSYNSKALCSGTLHKQ
jgi:hypothetical protein